MKRDPDQETGLAAEDERCECRSLVCPICYPATDEVGSKYRPWWKKPEQSAELVAAKEALAAYLEAEERAGRRPLAAEMFRHFFPPQQPFSERTLREAMWQGLDDQSIALDLDLRLRRVHIDG